MSGTSILIDHYRNPRHRGAVAHPDHRHEIHNRKCGDRITLAMRLEAGRLQEIRFEGEGCMYCLASASILCSTLKGMTAGKARSRIARFRQWIRDEPETGAAAGPGSEEQGNLPEDPLALTDGMLALGEVKAYPMRIDCAELAWKCADEMLGQ